MKIQSQFKDYYDYVQHVYGGGDPKIVYERKRIGEFNQQDGFTSDVRITHKMPLFHAGFHHAWSDGRDYGYWFQYLVVCGKSFPLIATERNASSVFGGSKYEVFDIRKHRDLVKNEKPYRLMYNDYIKPYVENDHLIRLSKLVGHPVFRVRFQIGLDTIEIDGDCPILGDLGLASVYPAEQLYQDLAYFLVNKMKDSPDVMPASPMTDKEKIQQHGFDVKASFRHRK